MLQFLFSWTAWSTTRVAKETRVIFETDVQSFMGSSTVKVDTPPHPVRTTLTVVAPGMVINKLIPRLVIWA